MRISDLLMKVLVAQAAAEGVQFRRSQAITGAPRSHHSSSTKRRHLARHFARTRGRRMRSGR